MQPVSNPIQACNDIFIRPNRVFYTLANTNNWSWVPFVLTMLAAMLPAYLYYSTVDFDWLVNLQIQAMGDVSPAEQEQFRQYQSRGMYEAMSFIGPLIALPLFQALVALYLHLTTKSDEKNVQSYTDWYGFTWWVTMPSLLSAVVALIFIGLADTHQISQNVLQPLSLAYWFNVEITSPWATIASSASLITVWTIYLVTVGITQWTSFSTKKAAVIAIAPFALIFGIWSLILLLS